MKLDRVDVRILQALQQDAHIKAADLAESLGLSLSPFYRRVRLLEESGIISGYATLLNQEKVGLPVSAYVSVAVDKKSAPLLKSFELEIANFEEVMECYLMTGAFDYMLRVVAPDIAGLERFVMEKLTKIEGVRDINTSISLRRVHYKTTLPVRVRGE
ncbi:winged helix-turn-helix transcriptional regulator [Paraburkholderia sp. NMBU_R16]|uniref:Lrp/AsnC family transcriptional regulator n=1 Tax=Paraburkholderia sp. NMBU_R16 TaxID=2698676 RepID=UPI001565CBB5|nr:Lrp/AsnC family transcriptional regulator [Paraburkholderia sp. NMBU_R16]NRO99385.1 winged helix-turn-helix transcriptional regulator [Paraburkholderia sp. NMBU_R16]